MIDVILGALVIMGMRIADVSLGTFRTILVVQGKKYPAATVGFFEVLIWIFAMRYIVQNMDDTLNLLGYAAGFGIGNLLGITLEEKVALGYVQLNVISKKLSVQIAETLRESKYGVTMLPAEGKFGGVNIILMILRRRDAKNVIKLINSIDQDAFITVQHSRPYRGFIHGARK
ncbi:MAG: UPF0316 protein YebE [Melioribacteraceae bacterium]|nr:MAG: UPF0316 protein YebE [Melioribacteraceae bacterium]